jgi:hypothetical protein
VAQQPPYVAESRREQHHSNERGEQSDRLQRAPPQLPRLRDRR